MIHIRKIKNALRLRKRKTLFLPFKTVILPSIHRRPIDTHFYITKFLLRPVHLSSFEIKDFTSRIQAL